MEKSTNMTQRSVKSNTSLDASSISKVNLSSI